MNYKQLSLLAICVIGAGIALLRSTSLQSIQDPIVFLQKYLRINTEQPKPDYAAAISFFTAQATADGFATQQVTLRSGLPALIITYPGIDPALPALALNQHMDVVPVGDRSLWTHDPFGGETDHGIIYGRGTQDMKGVGVVHYYALKEIKDAGIKLQRTVHLILVPEEEVGGFKGAKLLVETEQFKKLNIGYALDEGVPSGKDQILHIKVSERKPIQIRLTATGTQGHGSKLRCNNPIHCLTQVLARIEQYQSNQKGTAPHSEEGRYLSMNITSLQAGVMKDGKVALNAVPATATATVDVRVPQSMTMAEGNALIKTMIGENQLNDDGIGVSYDVLATIPDQPSPDAKKQEAFYALLANSIRTQGLKAMPLYFEATTDLRYYQEKEIIGLGFSPFTCQENLHGTNESVPVVDIQRGIRIMKHFLLNFCTTRPVGSQ